MKIISVACITFIVWFFLSTCKPANKTQQSPTLTENEKTEYIEKGKEIASLSFLSLSSRLQHSLEKEGVKAAVQYCNLAAHPIIDSLSDVHNVNIRRTAQKVRNPQNMPNQWEKDQLDNYSNLLKEGQVLKPEATMLETGQIVFFAPILVNDFCLQCHGTSGSDIADEDYAVIRKLYPDDNATGYVSGDLRGIWSIRFPVSDK